MYLAIKQQKVSKYFHFYKINKNESIKEVTFISSMPLHCVMINFEKKSLFFSSKCNLGWQSLYSRSSLLTLLDTKMVTLIDTKITDLFYEIIILTNLSCFLDFRKYFQNLLHYVLLFSFFFLIKDLSKNPNMR